MAYVIFSVPEENQNKIRTILQDDVVSRQSITTRTAAALEIDKKVHYVLIEGQESALARAKELFEEIATLEEGDNSEEIYEKIKSEEKDVATGVGFLFGD